MKNMNSVRKKNCNLSLSTDNSMLSKKQNKKKPQKQLNKET